MVETLIALGGTGLLRAIAPLFDSEAEELDAALGSVFSFLLEMISKTKAQ